MDLNGIRVPHTPYLMSDSGTSNLANLGEFLEDYKAWSLDTEPPPTLMDIAGFPHWENVYSNILAFLLDTEEVHGFGPLFIRSIVAAYRRYPDAWWPDALNPENAEAIEATDKIEREVSTTTGKRIDILIECAGFLVCIENKIRSGLHNDLGEYRKHCEEKNDGQHPVLGIVLSPHGSASQSLKDHRFVSITYDDLVEQVRQRMGNHIGPHNTQYQYLLFDFLEKANRFAKTKTMTDDQRKFLEFWQNNDEKISNIQSMCDAMWRKLNAKSKAQAHIEQCMGKLTEAEQKVFKTWIYAGKSSVFDLAEGGYIKGCGIHFDVEFHPLRVSYYFGKRRGCEPNVLAFRISANTGIAFDTSPKRPSFSTCDSPFKDSVCEEAVKTSVKILKEIAAMHFADQKIQQEAS